VEGADHGFTSIPRSIYWAIVTLTTVGYGDISPQTSWGQALAALIMLMGYGIIAVPTGIVTAEITRVGQEDRLQALASRTPGCTRCGTTEHRADATFCWQCGATLSARPSTLNPAASGQHDTSFP